MELGPNKIDLLTVVLLVLSGWLVAGWPAYIAMSYKYAELPKKFAAISIGIGGALGVALIIFAILRNFLISLCAFLPVSIVIALSVYGLLFRANNRE